MRGPATYHVPMGSGSIQLARVFGIRIGASPSWFLVLFIMIYGLSGYFGDVLAGYSGTTAYLVAVAGTLLFFVSLILHELGHALVARRNGIGISGIDLWFFGGLAKMTRDTSSPGEELRVAAAGPAVTLVIVALCYGAALLAARAGDFLDSATLTVTQTTPAIALVGWLAVINAFLFVFNMVPAFPLDGGRIARAVAWKLTGDRSRGTRFSARLGQAFAYLLIGFGVFLAFSGDPISGVWFAVLGWFLGSAARGAVASSRFSERLEGVTVERRDGHAAGHGPRRAHRARRPRRVLPALPLALVPRRRRDGPVPRRAARGVRRGRGVRRAPGADRRRAARARRGSRDVGARGTRRSSTSWRSEPLRRMGALMVVDGDRRLCGVVTLEQVRRALAAAAPSGLA